MTLCVCVSVCTCVRVCVCVKQSWLNQLCLKSIEFGGVFARSRVSSCPKCAPPPVSVLCAFGAAVARRGAGGLHGRGVMGAVWLFLLSVKRKNHSRISLCNPRRCLCKDFWDGFFFFFLRSCVCESVCFSTRACFYYQCLCLIWDGIKISGSGPNCPL